jgi:membrane protein YqaA with SNARE-associated domain
VTYPAKKICKSKNGKYTMIKELYNWTIHWAATPFASYALFFIAFAESSFFPLPPDILLIPMCLASPENSFIYAAICTVASVLGGIFGMGLGKFGGRPLVLKLLGYDRIQAVERLYQKYDVWAVGIAGLTPIPYKVFTIAAGIFRIRFLGFVIVSIFSRGARFFIIATLIYFWGEPIKELIDKYFNLLSIGFVVLLVGGFFAVKYITKPKKPVLD